MRPILCLLALLSGACARPSPAEMPRPPWYQLDDIPDPNGDFVGLKLRAGVVGEAERETIQLPPESSAAGPFGDLVLFTHNNGVRSKVEALSLSEGTRRVLVESDDVLRRVTVDPTGDSIYVFVLDQKSREEHGVFRLPLDDKTHHIDEGELVLPPLPAHPTHQEHFGPTFSTEFIWSDDGNRLAVQSCGEILCRVRVLDLATNQIIARDELGQGELIGLSGNTLLAYEAGNGWPCFVLGIDVVSGNAEKLVHAYGAAMSGATMVFEDGDARGRVNALELDTKTVRNLLVLDDIDESLRPMPREARALAGVGLPDGFIALGADGRFSEVGAPARPSFLRVADGALFTVE